MRPPFRCSDGFCGALDCLRCHPEGPDPYGVTAVENVEPDDPLAWPFDDNGLDYASEALRWGGRDYP